MYRYSRTEFDRVLEFLKGLYEPRTAEDLKDYLLPAIRAFVPVAFAANASYEAGDTLRGRTQRFDPPGFMPFEIDPVIARHVLKSPIVAHFECTHSGQFTRWSDIQPMSEFLRSAFYNEVYRPGGVKDCCTLVLSGRPYSLEYIGVGLHKQIPDGVRDILVSISPHVRQAFRLAETTSALIEMAAMKNSPDWGERGLIAIDSNGTITMETGAATRSLEKFFGKRTTRGLPEQLALWISDSDQALRSATDVPRVPRPLVVERAGARLTVHLLSKPDQNFLLLEEHRSKVDPAPLATLGLTARESEILAHIALGRTNPEIGAILGISSRTVSKHVEHILQNLGVETRTAAAAAALKAAKL